MRKIGIMMWLAGALLAAGIMVYTMVQPHDPITPDAREYLGLGENLARTGTYAQPTNSLPIFGRFEVETPTRMRQPLYPLFLAVSYWLSGRHALLVFTLQGLMNLASLGLTCLLGAVTFGKAFWPGTPLLLALYFPLWVPAAYCGTESLYLVLVSAGMFFLFVTLKSDAGRSRPIVFAALGGISFGAALLTRPAGLALVILITGYLGAAALFRRLRPVNLLVFIAAVAMVLLPWTIRNAIALREITPLSSEGGFCLWDATLAPDEPRFFESEQFRAAVGEDYYLSREAEKRFKDFAIRNIRANPGQYLRSGVRRVVRSWCRISNEHSPWWLHGVQCGLLLCALFGLAGMDRWRALFLLIPAIAVTVSLFFLHAEVRYVWPAMPFVLLLAGQSMQSGAERLVHVVRHFARTHPAGAGGT